MQEAKSIYSRFFHYLIPSVASLLSLSLYILADTFFISMGVGSLGVSALNIALPAYSVINATGMMLGVGAGVLYSVCRGQGDDSRADGVFHTTFCTALLLGAVFTAVGTVFARPVALLLGASDASVALSATYIRTLAGFGVFFVLNTTLNALIRNDRNPRLAMAAMIAGSMSNIALDYLFIVRFGWGMWGAAFATGLSPVISLCILSLHWIRGRSSLRFSLRLPKFYHLPAVVRGGLSTFIMELGSGLIIFLFNITLMRLAGDVAVAAYGIIANIALVIMYIFNGIGQGMQPVLSASWGRGELGDVRRVAAMGGLTAAVLGALFFLCGILFPEALTALFNSEGNQRLAEIAVPAMRTYFFAFLFMGVNICLSSYFQSILYSRAAAVLSTLRSLVLVLVGVAVFPRLWDIAGVWRIVPFAELATALTGVVLFLILRTQKQPKEALNHEHPHPHQKRLPRGSS